MGLCVQCKKFLPPGFMREEKDGALRCLFCVRDTKEIRYGDFKEKIAKKDEIVKEYSIFLKKLKGESDVLKKVAKGEEDAPRIILP